MKKRYILIAIVLFIGLTIKVNAEVGDLIYEITKLNISDTENGVKITFEGWAFIHLTNNFRGDFRAGKSKYQGGPTYEGGQEVMIVAEDQNGNKTYLKNILYDGYNGENAEKLKKYNFYYMQFFDKPNADVKKEYYTNYNHLTNRYDSNTCGINDDYSQCIHEDIGFHIEFNIENLNSDTTYKFYLYATNTDYNNKYNNYPNKASGTPGLKGKKSNLYYDKRNWAGSDMYFYEDVLRNMASSKAEITGKSYSKDKVFVTVHNGMPRLCNGTINNCQTIRSYIENNEYSLFGNKRIEDSECNIEYKCGPGDYVISVDSTGLHPGTTNYDRVYRSWAVPAGNTTITIKVKNDKKCAVSGPASNKKMNCNEWKDLSSKCDGLTVRNNGTSEMVKIEQKGYITNIFKSNLVNKDKNYDANSYNGGWLKYGITYYNEASWNYTTEKFRSSEAQENINYVMKKKLKSLSEFEENITLTINGLDGSRLVKKCTQSGSFTPANKLITVCTFFLPESYLKELTGNVNYSESNDNANINNKYYIPLDKQKHNISVKLENLSVLSENQAKTDSQNKNKPWIGTWTIDTSCSLKVTNRIYEPPSGGKENGKVKYKFIYRPINLSNPFPNRFPGVNWYTWYITEGNKDKKTLEDSYTKLEYYTELDNRAISKIKEYNKINNYFNKVETDFFKDYIKEGGNS